MTTIELRSKLHAMIDSVKSEEMLQRVHDLLAGAGDGRSEGVWATMSEDQRQRVFRAYAASFDTAKLSTTEEVMKRPTLLRG